MRSRLLLFLVSVLVGGALGYAWNWPGFKAAYEGSIAWFVDPGAPLVTASAVTLLAFVSGVSRICVP
jgi:hypothetical protein